MPPTPGAPIQPGAHPDTTVRPGAPVSTVDLLARHPWHLTPLGSRQDWDPVLAAAVDLVMGSPVAMLVLYGQQRVLVYNDAYGDLLGNRHPAAFGQPAFPAGGVGWMLSAAGAAIDRVYRTGRAHLEADQPLPLPGAPEGQPALFTRGYSALRDRAGHIIGVLGVVADTARSAHRLQNFGDLTMALSGAVTLDDVARTTLRHGLAAFDADDVWFTVDDRGGGGWRTVHRHTGELFDETDERLPPLWHPGVGCPAALESAIDGIPRFLSPAQMTGYRDQPTDRYAAAARSVAALPLRAATLRGAVAFGYASDHPWTPAERGLLATTGKLIAEAANRARLFETQHGTAQLLQRSMLPQALPAMERCRVAARYGAGPGGIAAGGDFYDAFLLDDGRLAVALGDVSGHDVRAAALMGQVRAGLRALALADASPASVLRGLDRLVRSLAAELDSEELFVTVACGVLDAAAERLVLGSAGHPPPMLRRPAPSGPPAIVTVLEPPTGPPLGLGGERRTAGFTLYPGDTVVFYSDGAVNRRGHSLVDGLGALAEALSGATSGDPRSLCALLTQAVPGRPEDDIAVLALELSTTTSRSATLEVPPEPTGPANARRWLGERLVSWQVPEDIIHTAALCASELVTNALLHAGTPARIEVDLSTERLLVVVSDSGTRGPITRTQPDALASRGRGLNMIDSLADAWGSEPTVNGTAVWFELVLVGSRA